MASEEYFMTGHYKWGNRFFPYHATIRVDPDNGRFLGEMYDRDSHADMHTLKGCISEVNDKTIINLAKEAQTPLVNIYYKFIKNEPGIVGQYQGRFDFDVSIWNINLSGLPEEEFQSVMQIFSDYAEFNKANDKIHNRFSSERIPVKELPIVFD